MVRGRPPAVTTSDSALPRRSTSAAPSALEPGRAGASHALGSGAAVGVVAMGGGSFVLPTTIATPRMARAGTATATSPAIGGSGRRGARCSGTAGRVARRAEAVPPRLSAAVRAQARAPGFSMR